MELDDSFQRGDDPPPGHPKCRCVVSPVVEKDVGKAFNQGHARDAHGRWTSRLSAAVAAAQARSSGVVRAIVGPVRRVRNIERLTGVNVRGFKHSLTNQGIAHALVMHGSAPNEAARGQTAITAADFGKITDIVKSPDAVSLGSPNKANGQPRIVIETAISGVRYTYIAEIQAGKRRIEMVSMWKK